MVPVIQNLHLCFCRHCGGRSIWVDKRMILPATGGGPAPHPDLPDSLKTDYEEAREIAGRSPRGAAALLRLTLQKLCAHLGATDRNLDDAIATLVRNGLPVQVQQALDVVRVIGNSAVHPGVIDVGDDPEIANKLMELINLIVQYMITQPRELLQMYDSLPEGVLDAIDRRDSRGARGREPPS